jgi:hypothetical protein
MANAKYTSFSQRLLNKEISMVTDAIRASLIDNAFYTFSASRDVPLTAITVESPQLTSPTIAAGVFDTADFVWVAVSGNVSEAIILWNDTIANDALCIYYDTGMVGMPVTPNTGNINVTVNASGWFTL